MQKTPLFKVRFSIDFHYFQLVLRLIWPTIFDSQVGNRVHAVYPDDGKLYPARIAEVTKSGYVVNWDDGTTEHRGRKRSEVLAMTGVFSERLLVA